jgi:hypothetical protein
MDATASPRGNPAKPARYLAAGWLHVVLSKGSFEVLELSVEDELERMRSPLDEPSH